MTLTLVQREAELLRLPPAGRARLAEARLDRLEEGDTDFDAAQADEAERRHQELKARPVKAGPAAETLAKAGARLNEPC